MEDLPFKLTTDARKTLPAGSASLSPHRPSVAKTHLLSTCIEASGQSLFLRENPDFRQSKRRNQQQRPRRRRLEKKVTMTRRQEEWHFQAGRGTSEHSCGKHLEHSALTIVLRIPPLLRFLGQQLPIQQQQMAFTTRSSTAKERAAMDPSRLHCLASLQSRFCFRLAADGRCCKRSRSAWETSERIE